MRSYGLLPTSQTVGRQPRGSGFTLPMIEASVASHRQDWTFVGRSQWTEDAHGVISNPTWTHATAYVLAYWPHETDDRQKQDFAFLHISLLALQT